MTNPTPPPPVSAASEEQKKCPHCGLACCNHCWECGEDVYVGHKPGCKSDPSPPVATKAAGEQAWTSEPWHVCPDNLQKVDDASGVSVATTAYSGLPNDAKHANAARIVACVNALAGLNPSGIKQAVQAIPEVLRLLEQCDKTLDDKGLIPDGLSREPLRKAITALASLGAEGRA